MKQLMPRWTVDSSTVVGAVSKQENGIGYWTDSDDCIFAVVADGASGQGCGAEAAATVMEAANGAWLRYERTDGHAFLTSWLEAAHRGVKQAAVRLRRPARAAALALLASDRNTWWAHLGDCRLYRIQSGNQVGRTLDDSVAEVLVQRGLLKEEEVAYHPDQARLLRAFGGGDGNPTNSLGDAPIGSEDALLLCSDQFRSRMTRYEINDMMGVYPENCQHTLQDVAAFAVRRGGLHADNTSAILLIDNAKTRASKASNSD